MPRLFLFAGLPGSGKTSVSRLLAMRLQATHLRIDTIEQGLRELCRIAVEAEGYRLAYRVAADNLNLGLDVVVDCCNPLQLTRREWRQVAYDSDAAIVNIEVICSDPAEHRDRVESRNTDIPGLQLPDWQAVQDRPYEQWTEPRLVLDTAGKTVLESTDQLVAKLAAGWDTTA
jgi:predicted kinase